MTKKQIGILTIMTSGEVSTDCPLDILADITEAVVIGQRNIGLVLNTGTTLVIDPEKNIVSKCKKFNDYILNKEPARMASYKRPSISFSTGKGKYKQSSFAVGTLVALAVDLVERNGVKRNSYLALEGNHKDGSGSGSHGLILNNSIENLELGSADQNKIQYHAWKKLYDAGLWFSLSAVKTVDVSFINYINNNDASTDINLLRLMFRTLRRRQVNGRVQYYFQ